MTEHIQYLKLLFEPGENVEVLQEKFFDFFPAIIYIYDLNNHTLRYLNQKFVEVLGYAREELKGVENALLNLVFREDVQRVKRELEKFYTLKDDESYSYNARLNSIQGFWRGFRTTGTVLCRNDSGQPTALFCIAQDITSQLKSEQEMYATRELFREIESMVQFGSWTLDMKTDRLEWTDGMYELLEYRKGEVEISTKFYLDHVAEEHVNKLQLAISEALKKDEFEHEYVISTKTGRQKIVATKGKVIRGELGDLQRLLGITRDMTEIRDFEKERERSIRELNRSNKELEEFAYVASHDLQEPLRRITTFSERLRNKYGEVLGEDGNLYLDRITGSARNMRLLIDNLLEFSKVTRSSFAFVPCDLNAILQEVLSDQELSIEETFSSIDIADLPVVDAVPSEIRQLFNNLISNALKFRNKNIKCLISIQSKKLDQEEKASQYLPVNRSYYKIDVKDNGIGFESMYVEKIFEIFQRLNGKSEYAGSGIGLAICKKIVDNHEGVIYATSDPGSGATFSIILPEKQYS